MQLRLEQWGAIWGLESQPMQLISLEQLKQDGICEARDFPPLTLKGCGAPSVGWETKHLV